MKIIRFLAQPSEHTQSQAIPSSRITVWVHEVRGRVAPNFTVKVGDSVNFNGMSYTVEHVGQSMPSCKDIIISNTFTNVSDIKDGLAHVAYVKETIHRYKTRHEAKARKRAEEAFAWLSEEQKRKEAEIVAELENPINVLEL